MDYAIVIFLVGLSGLFSGLTIGLTGLDKFELERKMKLGFKEAKQVYSVRRRGNLLLCTLLLGNVAVNSTLSIFLGSITSGIIAGLTATALIVIFGEIIPASVCSRYALMIGAKTAWLVKLFMFILFPICWPLAKALDKFLGEELPVIWSRRELKEIVQQHEDSDKSKIDADEEKIILGALSFSDKTVSAIFTPRTVVFALEIKTVLNKKIIDDIKHSGFTRIPVYRGQIDNIIGILYAKDLIGVKLGVKVETVYRKNNLLIVSENKRLDDLFDEFKRRRAHIAFVYNKHGGFEGVVTLEDVIEEIIGSEIVDETDTVVDMREKSREKAKARMEVV